jgi:two-component system sensor histidine kinase VicK
MNTPVKPHHLKLIKSLVLSVAGISAVTPSACRFISSAIFKTTNVRLSETTIKRLYGFAISKFAPSYFTLNTLATYCGFASWAAFVELQADHPETGSSQATLFFVDPMFLALLETPVPSLVLMNNAPDFTIITYNNAYQVATHSKKRDLVGMTLWEAYDPDQAGGGGPTLLLEAMHEAIYTNQAVHMEPLHYNIPSVSPGVGELSWWDVTITPVAYEGIVKYLLLNTYNITDKILYQDAIEQAIMKELTMAEDLAVSNVKLSVAVSKLAESHEQLTLAKKNLEEINVNLEQHVFERSKKLFESEAKQRKLIDNAPVAIGVLQGKDHVVQTANKKLVEYWGKGNTVIGKPLAVALPELEGQPFIGILNQVNETGLPYVNAELCALLNFNGVFQPRYYDMIYQPIQVSPDVTECIYIVAVDITEHVIARKKLEESESMLRLAVAAANIGIWSVDPVQKVLSYNPMFAKILGWESDKQLSYTQALGQVSDEYREKLILKIEQAIASHTEYDFIYTQKRFNDGKLIWIRGTGRITANDPDGTSIFSGVIREITSGEANL